MVQAIKRYKNMLLIGGSVCIFVGLIVPLVIYGIVAARSETDYHQAVCHYRGYDIIDQDCGMGQNNYTGILDFVFYIGNIPIDRGINIYCGHTKDEVVTYFRSNYDNNTSWQCWYEVSDPHGGWVGFLAPYDVNGKMMLVAGIAIFLVYVGMIGTYLIIKKFKSNNGYNHINNDLPV